MRPLILFLTASIFSLVSRSESLPGEGIPEERLDRKATVEIMQAREYLESLEEQNGHVDPQLLEPMISLANTLLREGRYEEAEDLSRRGQYITHMNHGVLNADQIPFLEVITAVYIAEGKYTDANQQQELLQYIYSRQSKADLIRLLPAMENMARWYINSGQYYSAGRVINQTLASVADMPEVENERRIALLRLNAIQKRLSNYHSCCGEDSLESVVGLLESSSKTPPEELMRAYIDLGDAYQVGEQLVLADNWYQKAIDLRNSNPLLQKEQNPFAQPRQLMEFSKLDGLRTDGRSGSSNVNYYRFSRYPYPNESSLDHKRGLMEEEMVNRPPDQVRTVTDIESTGLIVNDKVNQKFNGEKYLLTVGYPFQYIYSQVTQLVGPRHESREALEKMNIILLFNVEADGTTSAIEIRESNAPASLERLVRTSLSQSHFRPAFRDGQRVRTEGVTLHQVFR